MIAIITAIGNFLVYVGGYIAARWGLKVALIAAVLATYVAIWAALLAGLAAAASLMPSSGLTPFVLQFMPSSSAISFTISVYYGSMLTKRSWEYWRMLFDISAGLGAM
jgi:hypothetical protein